MKITPLLFAGLLLAPLASPAQVRFGIGVDVAVPVGEAPPPPYTEVMTAAPGPGYVWIAGHWGWHHRWIWMRGHWDYRPGYTWAAGHWANVNGNWVWTEGAWVTAAPRPRRRLAGSTPIPVISATPSSSW